MLEARLEGFGSAEEKAPIGDEQAKNLADKLENFAELCLKKYQEVCKLMEEDEKRI